MCACWSRTAAIAIMLAGTVFATSTLVFGAQKTAKDSGYSEAQAKRGATMYSETCAPCHAQDLSGAEAPALAGSDFLGFWDKTPVSELVSKIKDSMPPNAPGSLSQQQAIDIVAHVLRANKFPAGSADLPSDAAALKAITIVK